MIFPGRLSGVTALLGLLFAALLTPVPPAAGQRQVFTSDPVWSSGHPNITACIALGDVDGDGDLDVVCGNFGQSNTLYLNEAGTFSTNPAWLSQSEDQTRSIALGDVDGDGDPDMVCGSWQQANTLHICEGSTFSVCEAWKPDSFNTTSVALGDVDGDGDLDLVCGNDGRANMVYLNQDGVFPSSPSWSSQPENYTEVVALGDVDGDGDLDLVCGNYNQRNTLYLNEGAMLSASPAWSSGPEGPTTGIALGDVDGDGDLDLVCGNGAASDVLYLNEGGVFSVNPVWSSAPTAITYDVSLGDVDGDGDLDLVCGNLDESNTLYLNSGGVFSSSPDWESGPEDPTLAVALGDIDGDGDLDLVCGNAGFPARSNTMYLNESPVIRETPGWSSSERRLTHSVALGDVDGDGDLDLICGNSGQINDVYLNHHGRLSTSSDWTSQPASQTQSIALGDVDGDGDLDLVCGNLSEANTVYLNHGGLFSRNPAWASDSADMTTSVALGDVDGDGDLDLVCGNDGQSNVLYSNEGGIFSSEPGWFSGPASPTMSVALGDVDCDGDPDLVCGNFAESNTLYLNEGGVFSETPDWSSGPTNHTLSIALGDVDGDGYLDLVCGNENQSNVLYLNEGGAFSTGVGWSSGPANPTTSVSLGDVDGDGDLDLVCGNFAQSNTLYLNERGVFSQTPAWSSAPVELTMSIVSGDMDCDGDLDVVCGNVRNNTLYNGLRNPVFRGDPADPTNQLPDNSTFLGSVNLRKKYGNTYEISLSAFDVESDPVWVLPEYQFEGTPVWYLAETPGYSGRVGPFETAPGGREHLFDWDVERLPYDSRDVILRLRAISIPLRVSSVQHISSYNKEIGPIEPRRPRITSSGRRLSFPTVTVGDTASSFMWLWNLGNEQLTITSIDLPSEEMRCDLAVPHNIDPTESVGVTVLLEPRTEISVKGTLLMASNDPVTPVDSIQIETDIRALNIESRLLTSMPEVPLGEALTVIVTPAPQVRVERGFLYHGPCNTAAFVDSIPLSASANDFIALIPGEKVTEAGLEYYIKVENSGVFATDPPGAPDDSVFCQAVAPPDVIGVTPHPNSGPDFLEGRDITVLVSLPQGTEFIEGTLHLRLGGEAVYRTIALEEPEPLPTVVIPDSLVGARGLEYWVDVRTLTTTLTYPAENPSSSPAMIQVTVADLSEGEISAAKQYRMVAVPLDFGTDFTGTLEALLSDQAAFGPYDPFRWRSFRYLPSQGDYVELSAEYGQEFQPVPGRGFWLVCSSQNRISTAPVRGLSTATDSAYGVILEPGWNQIGNPFVFAVAWDSVLVDTMPMAEAEAVTVEPAVRWDGAKGYTYGVEIVEPFEGYWVKNLSDESVVLRFPPREAVREMTRLSMTSPAMTSPDSSGGGGWEMEIRASSGRAADFGNYFGVKPGAADEWDKHDRSEPPMNPGRAVSFYFPHESWKKHPGMFTSDIQRLNEAGHPGKLLAAGTDEGCWGHVWRFDVAKSFSDKGVGDDVLLEFIGLGCVPPGAWVSLLDRLAGAVIDLRDTGGYSFRLGEKGWVSEEEARFVLLVGSEEFINGYEDDLPDLPARTVLYQNYPNPFSASTIIRYDLARAGGIDLRIYGADGALVKILYEGRRGPGRHEAVWMGDNESGRQAAPGIYFCCLKTGTGYKGTHKILLIK